jgi:hypothetical protein
MALFISFLVHNNAPCTFFMIFMEEGWQGRTCNCWLGYKSKQNQWTY